MINFVIDPNIKNKKAIVYTIYYLTKKFNCEVKVSHKEIKDALNIYYGVNCDSGIYIPINQNMDKIFFSRHNDNTFITFNKKLESSFIVKDKKIKFNYDILYISKFIITCEEEYKIQNRDGKDRFISELSLRKENINIPFFNVNSSILLEAINLIDSSIKFNEDNFEVLLTHDVDNVSSKNIYILLHLLKENIMKKKYINAFRDILYYSSKNRYNMFKEYLEIEKKYDGISDFYFILGQKGRYGRRYSLDYIKEELKMLKENNNGIGMHTNYYYYNDCEKVFKDKKSLEKFLQQEVVCCRNHYLRFNIPDSWEVLSNINMKYDTTLGYSDDNGFRAGTCLSFIPFNLNSNSLISIYEVPLAIMDILVMENNYSYEEKFNKVKAILDYSKKYKGTISVLWHLCVLENDEYKNMYLDILEYIKSIGGIFVTKEYIENKFEKEFMEINKLFSKLECVK